jgi:hypothetical protein
VRWFGDPQLSPQRLAEDDYFSRQDMEPSFARDQLRFNQELAAPVDCHGPATWIAVSSSASPAVLRRVTDCCSGSMRFEASW